MSLSATDVWIVVGVVGVVTILFKAAGPVFLGRRALPERVGVVVALIAPVMLTALVVTQTFGSSDGISIDARVPGVAAAAVALLRGVPIIAAMVLAAAVTALFRLLV
jgi:branched-subunit amino acid transport protein